MVVMVWWRMRSTVETHLPLVSQADQVCAFVCVVMCPDRLQATRQWLTWDVQLMGVGHVSMCGINIPCSVQAVLL